MTPLELHEAVHDTLEACNNSIDEARRYCYKKILQHRTKINVHRPLNSWPTQISIDTRIVWHYATIKTELEINGIKYLKLQTV